MITIHYKNVIVIFILVLLVLAVNTVIISVCCGGAAAAVTRRRCAVIDPKRTLHLAKVGGAMISSTGTNYNNISLTKEQNLVEELTLLT